MICPTCGESRVDFHKHHIVPRSFGGKDIATNIIEICSICHSKIHGSDLTKISAAIRAGLERRRKKGLKFGRPRMIAPDVVLEARREGLSFRQIAKKFGVSSTLAHRVVKEGLAK